MEAALVTRHCGAVAAPVSALANMRPLFHGRVSQYDILPETLTVEPFVPVYRNDDPQWAEIINWTAHALLLAEAEGITQANAADRRDTGRVEISYLLGGTPGVGRSLGLDDGWAFRVVQARSATTAKSSSGTLEQDHRCGGSVDAMCCGRRAG